MSANKTNADLQKQCSAFVQGVAVSVPFTPAAICRYLTQTHVCGLFYLAETVIALYSVGVDCGVVFCGSVVDKTIWRARQKCSNGIACIRAKFVVQQVPGGENAKENA